MPFTELEIDEETRGKLLELLPPTGWNLIGEFFDGGAVKTAAARDATLVEDFLKAIMHHPQFKTALEAQHQTRRRRNLAYELGDEGRKVDKINGKAETAVGKKRSRKRRS